MEDTFSSGDEIAMKEKMKSRKGKDQKRKPQDWNNVAWEGESSKEKKRRKRTRSEEVMKVRMEFRSKISTRTAMHRRPREKSAERERRTRKESWIPTTRQL